MQRAHEQNELGAGSVPTELAERLLDRANKPVGVIDVRPAQKLHSRGSEWLAQRFGLVHEISVRHGMAESSPTAVATPLLRSAALVAGAEHDAGIGRGTGTLAVSGTQDGSSESQAPTQQSEGAVANFGTTQRRSSGVNKAAASPRESGSTIDRDSTPSLHGSSKVSAITANAAVPQPLSTKISSLAGELPLQRKSVTQAARDNEPIADNSATAFADSAQARIVPAARTQAHPAPESTAAVATEAASTPAFPLSIATGEVLRAPSSPTIGRATLSAPTGQQNTPSDTSSAAILGGAIHSTPLPLVQRKQSDTDEDLSRGVPGTVVPESPSLEHARDVSTAAPSNGGWRQPPNVVVRSHIAQSARISPLVLRQAETSRPAPATQSGAVPATVTALTNAPAPQIMRSVDLTSIVPEAPSGNSGSNGVNIADIAARVSRLLARQLEISRERQGKLR